MTNFARLHVLLWLCASSMTAQSDTWDAAKRALTVGDSEAVVALVRADGGRWPVGLYGNTLLHLATWQTSPTHRGAMISALLAAGAAVDSRNEDGHTALYVAASGDCGECVQLLLKAGAQASARSIKGRTPLFAARPLAATLLIAAGADIHATDLANSKPLHHAYHSALLPVGVNVRDRHGFTPLHYAALNADEKGVAWLVAQGADVSAQSSAPYDYTDGLGTAWGREPVHVLAAGLRPFDLAAWQHSRSRFSTQRHRTVMEMLDKITPRRGLLTR